RRVWLLLGLAVVGSTLGGVALGADLLVTPPTTKPVLLLTETFTIGEPRCPDRFWEFGPAPYCSLFNLTIPGPAGGLRAVYVSISSNSSCPEWCIFEVVSNSTNTSIGNQFTFYDAFNVSAVAAAVLAPGTGSIEISQGSGWCNQITGICTFVSAGRFTVS